MTPEHGNTGKRNAAKPDNQRKDAQVILRVRRADKGRWVSQARKAGTTLAGWIIDKLNQKDPKP